ncbi:uncharacterized protein [Rutidosis leptorrhynchoides]|uniref:uncharacterized protein n=1 Tax=Rutidosis leptorrhynchoides TaxID=125765 RepID=UPI003A9A3D25
MSVIETYEIGTLKNRRRRPLRSRTADTFFRILSLCSSLSSASLNLCKEHDKDENHVGSIRKNDVSLFCIDIVPGDYLCQDEMSTNETRVVLDTQEEGFCNKNAESSERDHKSSGERGTFSHKVETNSLCSSAIMNQDNNDMTNSSPYLSTDKCIEEGEISGQFMDIMLEDETKDVENSVSERANFIGIEPRVTNTDEDVYKGMKGSGNNRKRNLMNYSEIAGHGRFRESANILKNSPTKNQDLVYALKDGDAQNNRKRQVRLIEKDTTNKKAKMSVDRTPISESLRSLGEHLEDTSKVVVDATKNKDDCTEKKKKRTLTKERKAKKKRNERIKRAEKNRKLGVKRLKLEPVIREKKVTYCRHYLKGRCHEGEKCKFSHDTVPLTKSKPCCHYARHACMKGDECPFDHQLSKYPCNNHFSKGFCSRGPDCMFSHEVQPTETFLNASNELKAEQKPFTNSGSGSKTVDTNSCIPPTIVISNPERNFMDATTKLSFRPPKGITFLSRETLPLESRPVSNVNADSKEITKMTPIIQDSKEITKTPPVVPRGINFLSFGKKAGLDQSNVVHFIKMNNGCGKPRLSNLDLGSGSKCESLVDAVKVDIATDRPNSSLKPVPMLPFMSSASQKAVQSTLTFALKFESDVKTTDLIFG